MTKLQRDLIFYIVIVLAPLSAIYRQPVLFASCLLFLLGVMVIEAYKKREVDTVSGEVAKIKSELEKIKLQLVFKNQSQNK